MLALIGSVVYFGFFAVPPGDRGDGRFDPDKLAAQEVDVWMAAKAREEVGTFTACVVMLREKHRYSWFRAAQAAFYLSRAATVFEGLNTRYERVLPDLEEAAAVHKTWVGASFDPAAVARAQLTWWVTRRTPNLNSLDQLTPLVAEEYALRYKIGAGMASGPASRMAEAALLFDSGGRDPNRAAVEKVLADSYRLLKRVLTEPRKTR